MKNLPMRLYSFFPFDRSAKVRWTLTELGLPFEDHQLDREKSENTSEEYLRWNPMGRVPVLRIGDQAMFESAAICAHLADLHIDRGLAPALNSPDRAEYQKWMYFAASTLDVFQTCAMIIEDIPQGPVFTAKTQKLEEDLRDALTAMDRVLAKNEFMVGNRFSVADINLSYALYFQVLWPELAAIHAEFPRIGQYLERMKKHPTAVQAKVFSYQAD